MMSQFNSGLFVGLAPFIAIGFGVDDMFTLWFSISTKQYTSLPINSPTTNKAFTPTYDIYIYTEMDILIKSKTVILNVITKIYQNLNAILRVNNIINIIPFNSENCKINRKHKHQHKSHELIKELDSPISYKQDPPISHITWNNNNLSITIEDSNNNNNNNKLTKTTNPINPLTETPRAHITNSCFDPPLADTLMCGAYYPTPTRAVETSLMEAATHNTIFYCCDNQTRHLIQQYITTIYSMLCHWLLISFIF